ncbi:MAG: tRNA 4-thiouridine(8) synthase ThiI [Patescibacteria group bacterium]
MNSEQKKDKILMKNYKKEVRVLLLFSGGLDSILAAKILAKEGIKVTPLCFKSCFFDEKLAQKGSKMLGLRLRILDVSKGCLEIVKKPRFGYGKGLNPCIDCHSLMLKKAKKEMKKEKFDILATGEVLGERPFSQNRTALNLIEKEAGLKGKILRPLSAKLLEKTVYEKRGLIEREKLFAFQGKNRKAQLNLARILKIENFPSPAGGCILTDSEYAKRLKDLMEKSDEFDDDDCELLKRGRIFWSGRKLILVGRNEKENAKLKNLKKNRDVILEPINFAGPTVLIRGFGVKIDGETVDKGEKLILRYSKKATQNYSISKSF